MECTLCNLQYVGKNETLFNIRLNNHKEDVNDPEAILADKHFQKNVRIRGYSVRIRENADQTNSEYGHFSRSETLSKKWS